MPDKVAVIGAGAMGTACALLLAEHPHQAVSLWVREAELVESICSARENTRFLPGVSIPPSVQVTGNIEEAVAGADLIFFAIPSAFLRSSLLELKQALRGDAPLVSVIKGIENSTFLRPSQIITDVLGPRTVVALSGPSHAEEIACRLPASVVAACPDLEIARQVQTRLGTDRFRIYTNSDLLGVELGGALKNVIAIGAGICDGLGFGDNAKSALMTRGLVEMSRFGEHLGADPATFAGLAGLGDLITTCVSPYGRNRRVGERLGKGESPRAIIEGSHSVAEGVPTSKSVYDLARERGIDMPVTREVYLVLFEGKSAADTTEALMSRPPKSE